jgi:hypothetical protein
MAGIARNLELYILAYKLAWKYISEDHKHEQPDIARHWPAPGLVDTRLS